MSNHAALINEITSLLMDYSEDLAAMWATKPYRRVILARAFARGFVKNPEDDIHPVAQIVLDAAMIDQDIRLGLR